MSDSRFKDIIPDGELECIWASAGTVPYKLCPYEYDCDHCPFYESMTGGVFARPETERFKDYKFDHDVFYEKNHVWVRADKESCYRVGIDDFAQSIIGKIDKVEIANENIFLFVDGQEIKMNIPLAGTVVRVNPHLERIPELINDYPFTAGWIAVVKATGDIAHEKLYSGAHAAQWFKADINRLSQFVHKSAGSAETMQDGGRPSSDFFEKLSLTEKRELHRMFL